MDACFANPNDEMPCLPHDVSLTIMTESFEKQTPLVITFKTYPIPEKVYKSEPLGQFAHKLSNKILSLFFNQPSLEFFYWSRGFVPGTICICSWILWTSNYSDEVDLGTFMFVIIIGILEQHQSEWKLVAWWNVLISISPTQFFHSPSCFKLFLMMT